MYTIISQDFKKINYFFVYIQFIKKNILSIFELPQLTSRGSCGHHYTVTV